VAVPRDPEEPEGRREFVQSLGRGLEVITAFGPDRQQMTLSDVARHTGLTRATARRFLLTLVTLGYMRTDGKLFALTPHVLNLGFSYLSGLSITDVAQPHVQHFSSTVHESSSVGLLDGNDVVYVVRVSARRIMTVAISVGTRFPAYATSMGRVLLAALEPDELEAYLGRADLVALTKFTVTDPARLRRLLRKVRADGFVITDQELEEGLRSAAVPIRNGEGCVVAAINVSVQSTRLGPAEMRDRLLPHLIEAARRIEVDLGATDRYAGGIKPLRSTGAARGRTSGNHAGPRIPVGPGTSGPVARKARRL
jgi:IclR family transcriptional regulator, pca regulon regulatory protein